MKNQTTFLSKQIIANIISAHDCGRGWSAIKPDILTEKECKASTIEECIEALKEVGYLVIVRKNAKVVKVSWSTKYRWGYTHCELYNKVSIDISIEAMHSAIYSIINSKINE